MAIPNVGNGPFSTLAHDQLFNAELLPFEFSVFGPRPKKKDPPFISSNVFASFQV